MSPLISISSSPMCTSRLGMAEMTPRWWCTMGNTTRTCLCHPHTRKVRHKNRIRFCKLMNRPSWISKMRYCYRSITGLIRYKGTPITCYRRQWLEEYHNITRQHSLMKNLLLASLMRCILIKICYLHWFLDALKKQASESKEVLTLESWSKTSISKRSFYLEKEPPLTLTWCLNEEAYLLAVYSKIITD